MVCGLRKRVLESRREVDAVQRPAEDVGDVAVRCCCDDRRRVVGRHPISAEREARPVLPERPFEIDAQSLLRFVTLPRRHRVSSVQRVVTNPEVERRPPARRARPGRDVDRDEACFVRVRHVDVSPEPDRLNLILWRQSAAPKAVDAQHRAGAGQFSQGVLHFVGVVRQRRELFRRQHRSEAVAARIGSRFTRIAPDDDVFGDALDGETQLAAGFAAAHAHVGEHARLESWRLCRDRVPTRRQVSEDRLAALARRLNLGDAFVAADMHARANDHRAARVHDRHAKRRGRCLSGGARGERQQKAGGEQETRHVSS